MAVDHNAKEIRMLFSQTADHATNAGGTKGTTSTYYDSFQIAQGEIEAILGRMEGSSGCLTFSSKVFLC